MPELAPIQTQPPQGSCPSAEELACYIDGTLSPEERARVAEHLASCESCFEVYSEVLQCQLESEPAPLGKVVHFPPGEKRIPAAAWWSAIAASLLVGLGIGYYYHFLSTPQALLNSQVTLILQGKPRLWLGETLRGSGEDGKTARLDEASFRIGVQIANLQARLGEGEREDARNVIAYVLQLLETQDFTKPLDDSYRALGIEIDKAKDTRVLLPEADHLAQELRISFDPLYLDLGQWVEDGRFAAISRETTFFRRPETRRFLRRVLWRHRFRLEALNLPKAEESLRELEVIYVILGKTLQPEDFDALKDHYENILKLNYPE
jgi:hypothetical protein